MKKTGKSSKLKRDSFDIWIRKSVRHPQL